MQVDLLLRKTVRWPRWAVVELLPQAEPPQQPLPRQRLPKLLFKQISLEMRWLPANVPSLQWVVGELPLQGVQAVVAHRQTMLDPVEALDLQPHSAWPMVFILKA